MMSNGISRSIRRLALAAAALALLAGPSTRASAEPSEPCGGPLEQPMASLLWIDSFLSGYFPLSEIDCRRIVRKGVRACHGAVSQAHQCRSNLNRRGRAMSKTVCVGDARSQVECNEGFRALMRENEAFFAEETNEAHEECEGPFAETLYESCIVGIR